MNTPHARPIAEPTALSQPYWDGVVAGQLILQRCAACGVLRHYPRLLCAHCYSRQVTWEPASGRGHIHSWTVAHHAYHVAFADELPYTLVLVDLCEGPRALGRWLAGTPILGAAVQGRFVAREGGADLIFEPVTAT